MSLMAVILVVAGGLGAFLVAGAPPTSTSCCIEGQQFEAFLKIPTLRGDSVDARHAGEIELLSFRWRIAEAGAGETVSSAAAGGRPVFNVLRLVKVVDQATTGLFAATARGTIFPSAVLTVRLVSDGATDREYYHVNLNNVVVTSMRTGGDLRTPHAQGDPTGLPTEEVTLAFQKIEVVFQPPEMGGMPAPALRAGWDLNTNEIV